MMNSRIPVAPATLDRVREFSKGLGRTYDDTINFLLDQAIGREEDPLIAGRRMRDKFPAGDAEEQEE